MKQHRHAGSPRPSAATLGRSIRLAVIVLATGLAGVAAVAGAISLRMARRVVTPAAREHALRPRKAQLNRLARADADLLGRRRRFDGGEQLRGARGQIRQKVALPIRLGLLVRSHRFTIRVHIRIMIAHSHTNACIRHENTIHLG